jgi:hypothetical protein
MKLPRLYDKLVSRVRKDEQTGCWLWTGPYHKNRPWPQNRYGYITIKRPDGKWTTVGTHRAMMIAIHGWLPKEQCACHKCDVPLCVNPGHLFLGTMGDNIRDSRSKNRHHEGKKQYCDRGHPLFGDNVEIHRQSKGRHGIKRACKTCQKARYRLKSGWPEHLAWDMTVNVPAGYMLDRQTWEIVPGKGRQHSSASAEPK